MYILGLNAYHGDASAALIKDGRIVAAAEEERFNRVKHCAGFPTAAVKYCLRTAGIEIADVEHIGISRDPSANLHKKVLYAAERAARNFAKVKGKRQKAKETEEAGRRRPKGSGPLDPAVLVQAQVEHDRLTTEENGNGHGLFRQVVDRLSNAAKVRDLKEELAGALGIAKSSVRAKMHNIEHHRAHLASSFFVSPFERAALLSLDGFGDFISTMWGAGEDNSINVIDRVEYPHSLGLVYTATTQFLGFPHYGDEGKVMGLAPYGQPSFIKQFREIVISEKAGQFRLNLDYFRHAHEGVEMTWNEGSPTIGRIFSNEFVRLFGPARQPADTLTDRETDIAASLQLRPEEVAFDILQHLHQATGLTDLGLSGGVGTHSYCERHLAANAADRAKDKRSDPDT